MDIDLKKEIVENAQFPFGKRDVQYQSLDGMSGIRDMKHRFEVMGLRLKGEVLKGLWVLTIEKKL